MAELPVHVVVASAGFAAGMVFGVTAQRTNFCTMGAISDLVLTGQANRFRAWVLAWLSIVAGGWLGIKYMEEGSLGAALRAVFARG